VSVSSPAEGGRDRVAISPSGSPVLKWKMSAEAGLAAEARATAPRTTETKRTRMRAPPPECVRDWKSLVRDRAVPRSEESRKAGHNGSRGGEKDETVSVPCKNGEEDGGDGRARPGVFDGREVFAQATPVEDSGP